MMRAGTVPPWLRRALRPSPHCYGHCDRPLRGRTAALPAPGWLAIYACPGGAVSVVTYTHWANPDPTPVLSSFARRHTTPPSPVRRWDFRTARRHGPELGLAVERRLARARRPPQVRTVYWRVYPTRAKDGSEERLFACFRHGRGSVEFFRAPGDAQSPRCPRCPTKTRSRSK
ncbi:MAG: hypothetical protein ACLPZM_02915 [Thermoplasmata archaeon]